MNELEALLFLTHIPHLGSIKIRSLIQFHGSPIAAAQIDPLSLSDTPGFGPKIVEGWIKEQKNGLWKQQIALAEQHGMQIIPYTSENYPKRLLDIIDFPILLYVKGTLKKADQRCLAVIGTRQATRYGLEMASQISQELAAAGFTIVSGLARGIDTAAHEGALRQGRTFAVLGSGLGHIYPKENSVLAEGIEEKGALISEFPLFTPPDRQHFPQRNRIVSGMTMGTLLIEAPHKSGAMITIEQALKYGRKVFALPGRADQENFQGNHGLIKQGKAELIENSRDVLSHFDQLFNYSSAKKPAERSFLLEKEEEEFFKRLPKEEVSIEEIIQRTQIPVAKLNFLLMSLVLKKAIKEYPGKMYKKME